MEFTVNKNDLVRELSLSQGVIEKKTTIPILSNVLIEALDEKLVLTATDLELGIRCEASAVVKSGGAGTVPAKKLLDYVRLLPDADVAVKFSENHWANLTCGRSRSRMAGMSRESFPELPQMPEPVARIPIGMLGDMISKTIFAISLEESRFTLNGALLALKGEKVVMVATDGHRLSMIEHDNPILGGDGAAYKALLPKKAMSELLKLAADSAAKDTPIDIAGDENHLFFRIGSRLLMSRKLTGNFPDYERVLPKTHTQAVSLNREELRSAIERVAQFSDERSRAIKLRFGDNELVIYSSVSDTGESEESLAVEYGGPTVEIGFNALYLMEFLRAVSEEKVSFHFKDSQSAGELRPEGDAANYRYVVMPMRI